MTGPKEWRDLADALHDLEKHYSGSYEGALMEDAALALMDAAEEVERLTRVADEQGADADKWLDERTQWKRRAEAAEARVKELEARPVPCAAHDGDPLNPLLIGAATAAIHAATGWLIPPEAMEIGIGAYLRASK
jgi:hypothetical protein